ncbi:MAG: hypothetical protein ACK5JU_09700 [Bacteroidales bacterium]
MNTNDIKALSSLEFSIVKRRSTVKTIFSALIIVVGIAFFVLSHSNGEWITKTIQMALFTCGVFVLTAGIILIIWGAKEKIDATTGKTIRSCTLYYPTAELNRVMYFIESRNFKSLKEMNQDPNGGLQLEIYFSNDKQFVAFRIFEFKNYTYDSVSTVYRFEGEEAEKILSYLQINT